MANVQCIGKKTEPSFFWLGTHFLINQSAINKQQSLNFMILHFVDLLTNVGKHDTSTPSAILPVVQQWVQSVCSGHLVMSGLLRVRGLLLLLWASACLCLATLAQGDLIISGEHEAPQVRFASELVFLSKLYILAVFSFLCFELTGTSWQSLSFCLLHLRTRQNISKLCRYLVKTYSEANIFSLCKKKMCFFIWVFSQIIKCSKLQNPKKEVNFYIHKVIYVFIFQKRSTSGAMVRK